MTSKQIYNNMKKSVLVFSLLTFLVFPSVSFAQDAPLMTASNSSASAVVKSKLAAREENLRTRADTEIQRRTTALQELLTKIGALKHVPDASKTSYSTQIQSQISSLAALKAKIDADTDTATLKTDVQSIVTSYRIFAVFMPQIRILAATDTISDVADNLSAVWSKLQTRITTAKASGIDTSSWDTLLTDMQTKVTDAKTEASAIVTQISALTPEGYPGNKTTLEDARKKLTTAHQSLKTAAQDGRKIIQGLIASAGGKLNATGEAEMKMASHSGVMPGIRKPLIKTQSTESTTPVTPAQ